MPKIIANVSQNGTGRLLLHLTSRSNNLIALAL
jgi:hypothetical protein